MRTEGDNKEAEYAQPLHATTDGDKSFNIPEWRRTARLLQASTSVLLRSSSRRNRRIHSRNGPTADPCGPRASPVQDVLYKQSVQSFGPWYLNKPFLGQRGKLGSGAVFW